MTNGGLIAASPAAGFLPKDQLSGAALREFLIWEHAVSRRLQAALIAGAVAAVAFQVVVTYLPGPPPPLIGTITATAVGVSFLVAGLAAWQRWPASRLGLLFTIAGYAWILPAMATCPTRFPSRSAT